MSGNAYARKKIRERERQAEQARAGNDIAVDCPKPPSGSKLKTRERYSRSLLDFCRGPLRQKFKKPFSKDHLRSIEKMQRCILDGGNFALAMPRGSGKTTLILAALLWAILHGHKRYLAIIAADKKAAGKLLLAIQVELETNDELLELYPEACHPIRKLERKANRCKGQNWRGDATYIEWTSERIVFASIPNAKIGGAIIECQGINGRIRGMQHVTPGGETIRPDCFIVDDPQTNRSARSPTMVDQRLEIITGTCPGLAGPGEEICGFCLCTVVEDNDVADQLLNAELYPDWQGERFKLVYSWPEGAAADLWDEYANIYREQMAAGEGFAAATAYYKKNRRRMDVGFVVGWKERYNERSELSAQQHAYNLLIRLDSLFWKEYQNDPSGGGGEDEDLLSVLEIQNKANGFARGQVPPWANLVVGFIDVQDEALYWLVLGVNSLDYSAAVVDYGTYPEQKAKYFTLAKLTRRLSKLWPKLGREARIRRAILELSADLCGRSWFMPDGTTALRIKRLGLDAAWESRVVQTTALESPHRAILLPRFGRGISADDAPFERWKPRPGETRGIGWKIRPGEGGGVYALFDTNYWKNFTHARLATATGDSGSLSLFEAEGRTTHRMLAEHCRAERRELSKSGERSCYIFKDKPSKPDNHLWDCLAGAVAVASVEGAALPELRVAAPKRKKRRGRRRGPDVLT